MQRRIKRMETDIEEFDRQVERFVKNARTSEFPNLQLLREIKARKILVNESLANLVADFNCTTSMLKDPKRDFYSLWLRYVSENHSCEWNKF